MSSIEGLYNLPDGEYVLDYYGTYKDYETGEESYDGYILYPYIEPNVV